MDKDDPLVKRRSTLNPYLFGLGAIVRWLLRDMHPRSRISRRKTGKWKDKHLGEKGIILCNGSSPDTNFNAIADEAFLRTASC